MHIFSQLVPSPLSVFPFRGPLFCPLSRPRVLSYGRSRRRGYKEEKLKKRRNATPTHRLCHPPIFAGKGKKRENHPRLYTFLNRLLWGIGGTRKKRMEARKFLDRIAEKFRRPPPLPFLLLLRRHQLRHQSPKKQPRATSGIATQRGFPTKKRTHCNDRGSPKKINSFGSEDAFSYFLFSFVSVSRRQENARLSLTRQAAAASCFLRL